MESRLLIVDDELATRRLLTYLLKPHYKVFCAGDGREAKIWLDEGNKVDLLITDVQMPIMDGFELIESIENDLEYNALPIIVLSSLPEADLKKRLQESRVDTFLSKPIDPKILFWRIDQTLTQAAFL